MQNVDSLFRNAKLSDGTLSSIAIKEGRITSIDPGSGNDTSTENIIDLAGALVVPGFVEGHIHLDTSFYGDVWRSHIPCSAGFDVRERVEIQRENMTRAAPMAERARNRLGLCISQGSTYMRGHVIVDASVGLRSLEMVLAAREEYRDMIDIRLVAFPQNGIITSPDTADLLDAALIWAATLSGDLIRHHSTGRLTRNMCLKPSLLSQRTVQSIKRARVLSGKGSSSGDKINP